MLTIPFLILVTYTIIHMCQHVSQSTGRRIVYSLLIIFFYGWIVYWIWYAIKRPKKITGSTEQTGAPKPSGADATFMETIRGIAEDKSLEAEDRMNQIAERIALDVLLSKKSVKEKCRMLEAAGAYTRKAANVRTHNAIHAMSIYLGYLGLEKLTGTSIFESTKNSFIKRYRNGEITSLTKEYIDVLCAAGSIVNQGREFSIKSKELESFDLPQILPEPKEEPAAAPASAGETPAGTPSGTINAPTTEKAAAPVRKTKVRKVKRAAEKTE